MFAMLLFVSIILVLIYYIRRPFNYWKNKNVPSPPVSYLFGNVRDALLLKKSIQEVFDDFYTKYHDLSYVGIYRTRSPCILLRDPNYIKEVLVKSFNSFSENDLYIDEKTDPLFSSNPFACKDDVWKKQRNEITPSFTVKKVKEMYSMIETVAENLVKYIDSEIVGNPNGVEAKQLFIKYTTDVGTSCALGLDANSFTDPDSEYIKMFNNIIPQSVIGKLKLFMLFNFPSFSKTFKFKLIPDDVGNYYKTIIRKTLEYRKKNNIHRGDFLDSMTELKGTASREGIAGHVVTFVIEATETSSTALEFTLYELALNLDIQAKLRLEIDETVKKFNGKFNFDALQEMEYLDQVINENLRKNTIVPIYRKVCTQQFDFESPDGKGTNVTIEAGTPILLSVYSIHKDPKYYPNPLVFDPERFSKENIEKRPNYTFLPFGEGPRICLGMRFGLTQVKAALAHILTNFEVRLNEKTIVPYTIDPKHFLLEANGGIWLDFYKRQS